MKTFKKKKGWRWRRRLVYNIALDSILEFAKCGSTKVTMIHLSRKQQNNWNPSHQLLRWVFIYSDSWSVYHSSQSQTPSGTHMYPEIKLMIIRNYGGISSKEDWQRIGWMQEHPRGQGRAACTLQCMGPSRKRITLSTKRSFFLEKSFQWQKNKLPL